MNGNAQAAGRTGRLNTLNVEYRVNTPDDFRAFVAAEMEKWSRVVKEANIELGLTPARLYWWSMIFSENRCPSPIGVEDMLFGIMLYGAISMCLPHVSPAPRRSSAPSASPTGSPRNTCHKTRPAARRVRPGCADRRACARR